MLENNSGSCNISPHLKAKVFIAKQPHFRWGENPAVTENGEL